MSLVKLLRFLLLNFFLILIVSGYTGFASPLSQQLASNDTTKVIGPVEVSNIGIETEQTLSKIREYRAKVEISATEAELDTIIPKTLKIVDQWRKNLNLAEIPNMNISQVETLKSDFAKIKADFDGWRQLYTIKTEELVEIQKGLDDMKTKWSKTLELDRNTALPVQVKTRINTNLSEIEKFSELVTVRNNSILTKQTELTGAIIFLDDALNAIAEKSYKDQIFNFDMPPIWEMFGAREDTSSLAVQVKTILVNHKRDVQDFRTMYRSNIYWHLLFFAVLLFITFYLRNDVSKWSDEQRDEGVSYSLYLINHPISSALLITLLSSKLFYPLAPSNILNYYYILLIIPLLRLVPYLIKGIDMKYFYSIAGVFFLIQIGDYFSQAIIIDRIMLLIIDLLTLFIIINLVYTKERLLEKNRRINWNFAFLMLRLAGFVLTISILANVIGNTFFAKVMSRGTLIMVYGGMIIYAGSLVVRGLFSLIIQLKTIARLNMIQNYPNEVKRHFTKGVNLAAFIFWVYLTLEGYLIYDAIYNLLAGILTDEWNIGSISLTIGSVIAFFITLWIALQSSRLIRFILQDEILTHFELPRGVPGAISMIVRLVLIFLGFILAFGAAKIDMSNIAIVFGALGVGIGFGLQNIFNNLVSGLILAFERPVQVGDIIQISSINVTGEVKDIGIRATVVRSFDGAEIIVPNGNLISNEMVNWTLSDKIRRQEISVGVAYGTDTKKVLEILEAVIAEQNDILVQPQPLFLFMGFGDSSLDFSVRFWTQFDNGLTVKSVVGVAIDNAFKKEGIEIPFPQRDLHVRSVPEQAVNPSIKAKTTSKEISEDKDEETRK